METEVGIIYIIPAVGGAVAAQSVGEGRVFEVAPVGDDIVLIILCPYIHLYGKDDLLVLRISDAGKDSGYIGLALLAGVEGEIGAKHPGKSCLEGIAYHGEGGYVELACLLMGCVLTAVFCAFEKAASYVNEVYLIVRVLGSHCQGQEHKNGGQ